MGRPTGNETKDVKSESDNSRAKDHHAPPTEDSTHKNPKKRRKVNHGMDLSFVACVSACPYCVIAIRSHKANAASTLLQLVFTAVDL